MAKKQLKTFSTITTITAYTEDDADDARAELVGVAEDGREGSFLPDGADIIVGDLVSKDLDAVLDAYRKLHDGISDMIESGRISRDNLPDDYVWLVDKMVTLAGIDHGPVSEEEEE